MPHLDTTTMTCRWPVGSPHIRARVFFQRMASGIDVARRCPWRGGRGKSLGFREAVAPSANAKLLEVRETLAHGGEGEEISLVREEGDPSTI